MKTVLAAALLATVAGASSAYAIEPIQGSLNANAHVELAPVGSTVFNHIIKGGEEYRETYVVAPDHSLELTGRSEIASAK